MVQLAALDWFWIIAFLILMVGCGLLFYKLGKRSESDFFLAGRGLPWWLPACSIFATHTATDTPMWISGVVYQHGVRGIWYASLFPAWCALSAIITARIFRRSLAYTQAEWQSLRYGGLGSELMRGWMAGWGIFLNMFILGWVGMAMGKVCNLAFGWPPWIGLVSFSVIVALYVMAAGYWGVIMTDFQQGVIELTTVVITSIWGIVAAGGPSGIVEKLNAMGQGWRLDPFAFTGFASGDFPLAWFLTMLFFSVAGGIGMGTTIDWYAEAQRIQSAKTLRDASYAIWAGSAMVLLRNALWTVALLGFFVMYPNLTEAREYELGWFRMSFDVLPIGMVGFFFATIMAVHFSTISTHLNLGALYASRDFYRHYINPDASERKLVLVGRVSSVIVLLCSFLLGLIMQDITRWLIFALWIMVAGIWLPNVLQVVWWRFNAWGYLSAWIANLGFSWLVVWILPAYGVIKPLPDYLQFWTLLGLGMLVFLPVTLLTKPENMDHLVRYYVMTRPIGWWEPVRREAERQGLLPPAPKDEKRSGFIRRTWTAEAADRWSREDWIAAALSVAAYLMIMLGSVMAMLARTWGFIVLGAGLLATFAMYYVIDPKLRAVSTDYEQKQAGYLKRLEKLTRWKQAE